MIYVFRSETSSIIDNYYIRLNKRMQHNFFLHGFAFSICRGTISYYCVTIEPNFADIPLYLACMTLGLMLAFWQGFTLWLLLPLFLGLASSMWWYPGIYYYLSKRILRAHAAPNMIRVRVEELMEVLRNGAA